MSIIRQSNAEMLRLIAMFIIVLHHFAVHCCYPNTLYFTYDTLDQAVILYGYSFLFIGVNLFLLISGYFSIKASVRGFLKLYLIMSFYGFLYAITTFIIPNWGHISFLDFIRSILMTFFPFDRMNLWFMSCYLGLFLLSPLLNIVRNHMSKKQYQFALVLLTLTNVYLAWFEGIRILNQEGSSLSQMVYCYFIGGYIRKYITEDSLKKYRRKALITLLFAATIWGLMTYYTHWQLTNGRETLLWNSFAYNNVCIIIMAICVFCLVMSKEIHSKTINWLAVSSLAAYLLQEKVLLYDWAKQLHLYVQTYIPTFVFWIILSVIFFFFALLFDKLRIAINAPLLRFFNNHIEKHIPKNVFNN